jgi:hypothetical protein
VAAGARAATEQSQRPVAPHQLDTGMIEPEQEMQDGKARS